MAKPPNVIVFFTDQQRWDSVGLNGNPLGLTPNFDRIARSGTHLPHLFSCQPVCGPARSCLQTGLYATQTGCYRNNIALDPSLRTLAHHFNDAGYHTSYIGKWHLGESTVHGPVAEQHRGGYQEWLGANALEHVSDAYACSLYDGDGREHHLPGYRVDAMTDAAIRYVSRDHGQPFFLFFSLLEPHHQNNRNNYPAPEGYAGQYAGRWTPPDLQALVGDAPQQLGGYWGMVKRIDEAFGRFYDALRSLGLLENTILLFTADHGCHFRTRNREYKRSCHDSALRVPGLLTGPGFEADGELPELVSLVDLPPTLLDAAGLDVPEAMMGRSLLPLLRRETMDWPEEVFAQLSESQTGRCIRTAQWTYSVRAEEMEDTPAAEVYHEDFLYDNIADPWQLCNLAGVSSYRAVADGLRKRLIARMCEAGEKTPDIVPAPKKPSYQRSPILPKD